MQPIVICLAPAPGMIYLNGRFAGEAGPHSPLYAPISPGGVLYLEYRPLSGDGCGLARRLVFSGGQPLAESLADAEGLRCVAWPGGAVEVALSDPGASVEHFALDGLPCSLRRGEGTALSLNGVPVALPRGAGLPRLLRLDGAATLLGETQEGGHYLAALSVDLSRQTGLITADFIEPADGGLFSAFVALGDSVGHGRLEQWLADANGLSLVSSQSAWSAGAPRWPTTAEGVMVAAAEAALADLPEEAAGYLSPALAAGRPFAALREACDLCVPMKYPLPDPRPCVGLLKAQNDHLATVRPLYYHAEPAPGPHTAWQIDRLWLE